MPVCAVDRRRGPLACLPRLGALAVAGALLAGSAIAGPTVRTARAPGVPLPPPRPDAPQSTSQRAPAAIAAQAEVPSPPPRPNNLEQHAAKPAAADPAILAEESACLERLTKLGVRFEPLPAIAQGECGTAHPLRISSLGSMLQIAPPATLACPVAEALARWTAEVVIPESRRHLEAEPSRIAIGTSYECRSRNRQEGAKLSEHAFANAVDVSGFEFGRGKTVQIGDHPAETPPALFQAAIRSQACAYFTTVLGPGSDAAHATHLHLDLRGRKGNHRLCQ
jgi:hypothetical protein